MGSVTGWTSAAAWRRRYAVGVSPVASVNGVWFLRIGIMLAGLALARFGVRMS